MGKPLIISASRRTDLPGYHAQQCACRIRQKISRLRTRFLYGVVFWTKHTKPFLPNEPLHKLVAEEIVNPVINLTITGLGKKLEPGIPVWEETLKDLPILIETFHGDPWRIRWRFDPLIAGESSLDTFEKIARVMSDLKVPSCTFSFPAYRSLKGDLNQQFNKAKIKRWTQEEKERFLKTMAAIADDLNIELLTCNQPENLAISPLIKPAQCIPAEVLKRGFPGKPDIEIPKDFSQRTSCNCITSEDMGDYEKDRCKGGCVYCYSKASDPL